MRAARSRRLVIGLVLLGLFVALYAVSNLTVVGQTVENSWARQFDQVTPGLWLDDTRWFPPFHFDVATLAVGTLLAVGTAVARRRWRSAITIAIAVPSAIAGGEVFKHVAGRPHLVRTLDFDVSYPSGHAGIALVVTAALIVAVPRRPLRWIAPVLIAWCLLVVGGLQAEGQHRASEVVGSALLISAVFSIVSACTLPDAPADRVHVAGNRRRAVLAAAAVLVAVLGAWDPVWWQVAVYSAAALVAAALVGRTALASREPEPGVGPHRAATTGLAGPEDRVVRTATSSRRA